MVHFKDYRNRPEKPEPGRLGPNLEGSGSDQNPDRKAREQSPDHANNNRISGNSKSVTISDLILVTFPEFNPESSPGTVVMD